MAIYFSSEEIDFKLKEVTKTRTWIKKIIQGSDKKTGEIHYIFCSDSYLFEMNKTYLKHDTYTDIITFDYTENNRISGDLFISIDRISENAEKFNIGFGDELKRVMIHGILHLLGYKDKTKSEANLMREMEEKSMQMFDKQ